MIKDYFTRKFLPAMAICLFGSIPSIQAEQAKLSNDLRLHIPVIHFQNQYLWADLEYFAGSNGSINFKVKKYDFLAEEDIAPRFFDLAVVTEGAEPAIVDIKATEARLTFVSSIPVACSVVYGKTPSFGKLAIDANMSGGAIIDHNPILTDLEADTLYYYRVQGTDAEGKLYWAPISSFTTADGESADNNLLSSANGATITAVSSNYGGAKNNQAWGADSAIDGSSNTAWSSAGDGDNAFIEIALAKAEDIDTIKLWSRAMSDGTAKILSFTISTDDEVLGPFTLADTQQAHSFAINRHSASIRLDVITSTGGNTGLIEISAFSNQQAMDGM
ncbi:MAG: discoidin domain-containing protein [Methyloprofundus sp.]|nr:discoidin domain-containing protein [Methyloprofundus sp.]